ncbi:C40 family peptidase [Ensifer sp. ENS10]|uniref:Mov34/MPN/PAD-1 family protein n=1 Tax=Ensifer sp. ENS10 TaxID=2769286 RepID=UPI00177B5979|nr:Mov34/MPN/PAD-1 family protein [Ensifer sp. ENS10]MBD9511639.1 C40 family peptidase [Ensifer sp. ENS10]
MSYPFIEAFEDAKAHARREFPKESCGLIVKGKYIACENIASDPSTHREDDRDCGCQLCSFEISGKVYAKHEANIDVVVHSHPNGPFFPSKADMEGQLLTEKPWAILVLDEERAASKPVIWGGDISPVLGREFMHGVTDCYAIIKDCYALGKDKLAEQGIVGWPHDPITIPEFPRQDAWWEGDDDLYEENFGKAGFVETKDAPQPGDVFLMKIRSSKSNHAGLLIGDSLIVHHLPSRLSRREPAGLWGRQATKWLRYKGAAADA